MKLSINELILNDITVGEARPEFSEGFEDYKKVALYFLIMKNHYVFAEDILSEYSEGVTLEAVFNQNRYRFIEGAKQLKNGEMEPTWYDILGMDEIRCEDNFFDFFFACKLRHLNIFDIDDFLSFHLQYSFQNRKTEYYRFLQLLLRQYGGSYHSRFDSHVPETVQEWAATLQTESDKTEDHQTDGKIKGRKPREPHDNLTCLNQVQTAMLIEYMQQAGMILDDHNLNDKQAGTAFNLLTGYSIDSLRLRLGKNGLLENAAKHEDYKELYEAIMKLAKLIEPKTRRKQ